MAHKKRRVDSAITLPFRVGATVDPIVDPVCVGEWIVGYEPPGTEHDPAPQSFDFKGTLPSDWFTAMVNFAKSQPTNPEAVRRFLLREGTFRVRDWVEARDALKSGLPDDVKEEIRHSIQRRGLLPRCDKTKVYVLHTKAFYKEWHLLESLALIAGRLAQRHSPALALRDAQAAKRLLQELWKYDHLPWPEAQSDAHQHQKEERLREVKPADTAATPPLSKARWVVTSVIQSSMWRALTHGRDGRALDASLFFPRLDTGFQVTLRVRGILGIAYLTVLAAFSHGWKRCSREDCANLFRVTDDKRKVFCSQYCGHLVSLRAKRAAARNVGSRTTKRGGTL